MKLHTLKRTAQIAAALGLSAIAFSAQAAGPIGCEAKGAMYIVENGTFKETIVITPGAGTTAAASNQGHAGFKTDANGVFNISFTPRTLVGNESYYFRMETYNSQYLAYGTGGFGNSSKTITSPLTAQVVCASATPSQAAGVNFGAPIVTSAIPYCNELAKTVSIAGKKCYAYRAFSTTHYTNMPAPGVNEYSLFMDITLTGNNTIPRCTGAYPSNAPGTGTGMSSRCLRKYMIIGPASGSINKHATIANPMKTWVPFAGATDGQEIMNPQ